MENIMSKSNDSSKLGRATQVRELRDDELENVSGGVYQYMGGDEAIVSPKDPNSGLRFSLGASNPTSYALNSHVA